MLLDIGFFDDAVPTSTLSRPGPEAAEAGEDVPDWASQIARLKKKIPYRYVTFCLPFA